MQEFAQKHEQNERERRKKEQEMKNELENREQEIRVQRELVAKAREDSEMTRHKSEMEISDLKNKVRKQKEDQLAQLSKDMKRILELEAERSGILEETVKQREDLRQKWESKSKNVHSQNEKLNELKRQYQEKYNALEEERREALLEKEQFEKEKENAFKEIKTSEEMLEQLRLQRELALEIANNDIKNRREMLELDFMEQRKELADERKFYEDRVGEYEVMTEFAADNLAEAQTKLEQKAREENERIEKKKSKYREFEEQMVSSVKKTGEEIERKRQAFEDAAAAREAALLKEKENVRVLEANMNKLAEELDNLFGDEREKIKTQLDEESVKLESRKSQLALLQQEDLNVREQLSKELEEEMNRLDEAKEQMPEMLDRQMVSIDELDDSKLQNLEVVEEDLKEAQRKYNQVKMLLNESKKHVAEIEQKQNRLSSKAEAGFLHIANFLERDLSSKGLQDEVYVVREHKIALKDIEAEGKLQLAHKQEKLWLETEKISEDAKGLSFVLDDLEKTQDRSENEFRELQEKYHRDRKEEGVIMESLMESLRDMEEESFLSRSLSESEITNERGDDARSSLEREKRRYCNDVIQQIGFSTNSLLFLKQFFSSFRIFKLCLQRCYR